MLPSVLCHKAAHGGRHAKTPAKIASQILLLRGQTLASAQARTPACSKDNVKGLFGDWNLSGESDQKCKLAGWADVAGTSSKT